MTALWGVGQVRMGGLLSNALYLPGSPSTYAETPDSPANSIAGDMDIRLKVAAEDWTPSPAQTLMAKVHSTGTLAWAFYLTGGLQLQISTPSGTGVFVDSTAALGFTDGTAHWVRVTHRKSDGRHQFFTSDDGSNWTQLGADVVKVSLAGEDLVDSSAPITIGCRDDGGLPYEGIVYYADLRDGIGGTVVQSFDAAAVVKLGTRNPSTVAGGGPWTINGAGGWDWVLA